MPTINPASDVTARKRYCLTTGQGSSNCCSGPAGTSGPAGPPGPTGPPGSESIPGALWNIIYSDGASGASASPFLTYDILNDRLGVGQGVAGIAKVQASTSQIAIGSGAGALQSTSGVVAIGNNAGYSQSGLEGIAIGYNAGYYQSNNADRAIAIGAYAGQSQTASSIILNAAGAIGATTDSGVAGFFVKPIRAISTTTLNPVCYNILTNEVVYNTAAVPLFTGYVAGVFEATSDFAVTSSVSSITYDTLIISTGGLALGSPSTNIVLPVVGIYEITSILQCSTAGSPTTISAWHFLYNGSTTTETSSRTVTVTSGEVTILTITSMVQTVNVTDYVGLQVYTPANATIDTTTVGSTPNTTNPAVITTIKRVG